MKNYNLILFFIYFFYLSLSGMGQGARPLPNHLQMAWHNMEYYLFVHFGPNTFTGKEWGDGKEDAEIFNPPQTDCRQWARIARQSGATGIIITAKHHDGFCLWPSKYSKHTVRETKCLYTIPQLGELGKYGQCDILKELSKACKEFGLKFGVYISPWDRNHPDFGTAKYNDFFVNMLKEIFTNYGPIWELWWDRANGEGPNARLNGSFGQGKQQVYDWNRYEKTVREISPGTLIFSDIGPDIRWVGNENGIAGKTNWNYLDTAGYKRGIGAPHVDTLSTGNVNGKNWIPAECDVSIRPGWFYHADEDNKVKSGEQLFNLYLKSVGWGANFLLNVPPDRRGLIHEKDSAALMDFKKLKDQSFKNNLLKKAKTYWEVSREALLKDSINFRMLNVKGNVYSINRPGFMVELPVAKKINCIVLQEAINLGQSIQNFKIVLYDKKIQVSEITGTTIGRKRILTFPSATITSLKVYLDDRNGNDNINGVAAYLIDEKLVEK